MPTATASRSAWRQAVDASERFARSVVSASPIGGSARSGASRGRATLPDTAEVSMPAVRHAARIWPSNASIAGFFGSAARHASMVCQMVCCVSLGSRASSSAAAISPSARPHAFSSDAQQVFSVGAPCRGNEPTAASAARIRSASSNSAWKTSTSLGRAKGCGSSSGGVSPANVCGSGAISCRAGRSCA